MWLDKYLKRKGQEEKDMFTKMTGMTIDNVSPREMDELTYEIQVARELDLLRYKKEPSEQTIRGIGTNTKQFNPNLHQHGLPPWNMLNNQVKVINQEHFNKIGEFIIKVRDVHGIELPLEIQQIFGMIYAERDPYLSLVMDFTVKKGSKKRLKI